MRRFILIGCFFLTSTAFAGNLISSATWSESGDYKMAREDKYPGNFSTNTISRCWDGTTIKLFGGKGELLTWATYLIGGTADATNVMVSISSFTGTGTALGSGFSAVAVSSSNVWDYSTRPYSLYKYSYLQLVGMGQHGQAWDPSEYDSQQVAPRWRRPSTLNGNNDSIPNGGTLWTDRADHDKFYPDPAVPIEEFGISSFTVSASSSQAIGGEVYISTALPAGTYTATLTVTEGVSVSTTIPISLLVYNVTLPGTATLPVIADLGLADLSMRLTGTRFPTSYFADPYLTNSLRVGAFLHRHKIIAIGDQPASTQDYPSALYSKFIDGTAYTPTYGYGNGPGAGAGDKFYMVGTYGGWQSVNWSTTTVTNGSTGYCDNVSSWTYYCQNNNLNCQLYTSNDEASTTILGGEVNTLSTWSSTATACANGGHRLPFLQTGTLPTVESSAPYVNTVLSTSWLEYSSATWVTAESLYNTSSTHSAGGYNAGGPGTDSLFNMQEEGLGPREVMWGAYATSQKYWFLWEINYWNDSNNSGQTNNGWNANAANDNNMFNLAKDFGYDSYPSTDPVKGHLGFGFSNGDGNMLYPSTDTVYASPSYGFNGVIGSWRLNQLTRGIQDVDIINAAYAVNPSSTTALVNQQVQDVMYKRQCFTMGDCSYSYGPRPWNENLNSWETTRESLLQIAAVATTTSTTETFTGTCQMKGVVTFK